jgi:hypothetical protein
MSTRKRMTPLTARERVVLSAIFTVGHSYRVDQEQVMQLLEAPGDLTHRTATEILCGKLSLSYNDELKREASWWHHNKFAPRKAFGFRERIVRAWPDIGNLIWPDEVKTAKAA